MTRNLLEIFWEICGSMTKIARNSLGIHGLNRENPGHPRNLCETPGNFKENPKRWLRRKQLLSDLALVSRT